jgi:hypothetical protein
MVRNRNLYAMHARAHHDVYVLVGGHEDVDVQLRGPDCVGGREREGAPQLDHVQAPRTR